MNKARPERSTVADQVIGAGVGVANARRIADELAALARQDACMSKAMEHVQEMYDFLGDPSKIIGNPSTKHGEIAEAMEVHITNAEQALKGNNPTASFDLPNGRIDKVDYRIDDVDYQSKFINGLRNGLNHIDKHRADYPDFVSNGGKYAVPRDDFEILKRIAAGESEIDGLSPTKVRNLAAHIKAIEDQTGKPFEEVVTPSRSTYAEVQQGAANDTTHGHEDRLREENDGRKEEIRTEHEPSWSEGLKVAGTAAAIAGGVSFVTQAWKFHKEGRNIFKGELTKADWKRMGIEVGSSAGIAAVTASGIYAMTNCAGMAAPLAAALASAAKGIGSLAIDYKKGKITLEQFAEMGLYVCGETAAVSLASVAGQTLIPIPVFGAVIGSLAGKLLYQLAGKAIKDLKPKVDEIEAQLKAVIARYELTQQALSRWAGRLDDLMTLAFDREANTRLVELSAELAVAAGVREEHVLKSRCDFQAFMQGKHTLNTVTAAG
ncbi:hypothetical protein [Delftia tsuruhatensis]|uniref:hypothetical protein n=1 Tax=Delftia tsuruhatensis TaxID=180282 RepID=UPI00244C2370|nr:hypothetical protein [Delftia tsuruhatensis]MDH0423534.1 hypothetical protein [Delftia tsuruhatensis]